MKKKLISFAGDDRDEADDQTFNAIRDLAGEDAADRLVEEYGGTRLSLPRPSKLRPDHPISLRLGHEIALKIVEAVSPEGAGVPRFWVPNQRDHRITKLLAEDGMSAREVAQMAGVHMRTIYRHRERMRAMGKRVGNPTLPKRSHTLTALQKGELFVQRLLLEGHSPSQIRDILNVPGAVVLMLRAELLRKGKL